MTSTASGRVSLATSVSQMSASIPDREGEAVQFGRGHRVPKWCQLLLDPADRTPAPQQEPVVVWWLGVEGKAEHRPQLRLGLDVLPGEGIHCGFEPCLRVRRRVLRQERALLDLRMRGD
jgi:hypothetical protein